MSHQCGIETEKVGADCVVRLHGEIDLSNAQDAERQLVDAARGVDALVVDLADVGYIDSSGFGMLERLAHQVPLRIVVPDTAVVARAFSVTGIDQIVAVYPNVDAALKEGAS
jgi:anti-anti-sigma factor